jgi:hypothetical protein
MDRKGSFPGLKRNWSRKWLTIEDLQAAWKAAVNVVNAASLPSLNFVNSAQIKR